MTPFIPEQFTADQKVNVDTFFELTGKVTEGVEKIVALNLQIARSALEEMQENLTKAPATSDPMHWIALQTQFTGPSLLEKSLSYGRQLFEIAMATQAEIAQLAQARYEVYNARAQTLINDSAKNTPASSEAAIAAWKSAFSTATTLYETVQKTGKQALQVAGSNLDALTSPAPKPAGQAAKPARSQP